MTEIDLSGIAFYAPMKSPKHPVPSGDREMARNLMALLAGGPPGQRAPLSVELVSQLRIFDKEGRTSRQQDLAAKSDFEVDRLLQEMPPLDLWVTYHNYYKAPDLIGPRVARARNIPYVQIESTRAQKRLIGPWSEFAAKAHAAADAADVIFYLTNQDKEALERDRFADQILAPLPPFLPFASLPKASTGLGPMLTAGMMREGDKLASYQLIADTLGHLNQDWRLDIAGDGPARAAVEALMAPFGTRIRFLGQLAREELARHYEQASLFLWPGVNEAFGMVYLEAQSHGLPVVAQDRPGLRDVLSPEGQYPRPEEGSLAIAQRVGQLLREADLRHTLGQKARRCIAQNHLATSGSAAFWSAVTPVLREKSH
ncbi:glycosyltransferase, group 1 [Roseobacter sp. SK209-2-6]|uniref:glycosyltransferase family 4 protein n=1 Tax=Roseobacter sp. SK209-2-6 TaxID=388739 RepID=UPI0000F3C4E3|nr:glycosyltransferase, group 1 [Roseobacter sp. SK209-2-6]